MGAQPEVEAEVRAACDAKTYDRAATLALESYGPQLLSYLLAVLRNASDPDDVYGVVCESLWKALPTFRWDSSLRTFAYTIPRHAYLKHVREPRNRRAATPL